jgi:hypothetical protein
MVVIRSGGRVLYTAASGHSRSLERARARGLPAFRVDQTTIVAPFDRRRWRRQRTLETLQRLGATVVFRGDRLPAHGLLQMERDGRCLCLRSSTGAAALLRGVAGLELSQLDKRLQGIVLAQMLRAGYAFLAGRAFRYEKRVLQHLLEELVAAAEADTVLAFYDDALDGAQLAAMVTGDDENWRMLS